MDINQLSFNAAFNNGTVQYPGDCERICSVASARFGIVMTPHQAEEVWEWWSAMVDAGWLILRDDDEEIAYAIRSFVEHRLEV